jgi:archaellum component FlaG (FlaF/FlaG flagellin family)
MFFRKKKAQNTLEYALLIAAVVAGVIAMQYWVKRGFQGKMKESSDDIGQQFAPGNYRAEWTTKRQSATRDMVGIDDAGTTFTKGKTVSQFIDSDIVTTINGERVERKGSETITANAGDYTD